MKELKTKNLKYDVPTIGSIISSIGTIISLFFQFAEKKCDSIFLKCISEFLLTITFIFLCRWISKNKVKLVKMCLYIFCFLFFLYLAYYIFTKKCAPITTTFSNAQMTNSNNTVTDNSLHNDNSVHNNLEKNIYKGLQQRKINSNDIAQLESNILEKDSKVLVQYLESSPIDTLLQKQVIVTLSQLGYLYVYSSPAKSLPANLSSRRLNIQKIVAQGHTEYRVIINPQQ